MAGMAQDITAQRLIEEQLQQAHKMEAVGRLAGGVAHDFNNLLTGIFGLTELACQKLSPAHPVQADLAAIQGAAERAAALTRQLLAFGRTQILQPTVLDVNTLVRQLARMLQRLLAEDIALVLRLTPGPAAIHADASQIEQIVLNLAINARDAMPTGGRLEISTAISSSEGDGAPPSLPPGKYVLLTVTDTGAGMDEQTKARIFEPFFTTKPSGKGTGLGLASVYAAIEQLRGAISVTSALGEGTTFRLYFPAAVETAVAARPAAAADHAHGAETVLLVEDEDIVRDLARTVLHGCGYTVLDAHTPTAALQRAAECKHARRSVHLLLTDVVLPEMSGPALAEEVSALLPGAKVLFISGHTEDTVLRHGIQDQRVAFLSKPFTPAQLSRKVRAVLDGAPSSAS
jgi:nitrogen-specific signal transduction histidine kinase